MKIISAIGIDLAKTVFQVYAADRNEKAIFNKKVSRSQLPSFIRNIPPCRVFMESCGGSHYWAKMFREFGHDVKLVHGRRAKQFVTGNKSDAADAQAILTAGLRPETRFVPDKTAAQLEMQALHRIRSRLVKERTAVVNEMRGLLYEHGFIIPVGIEKAEKEISELLAGDELSMLMREIIGELYSEYLSKKEKVKVFEQKLLRESRGNETIKRLMTIPGVGFLTASAVAGDCNPNAFRQGRGYAASLGLVPAHTGSGGKTVNLSISKRGDAYIRTLLIHGARSIMRFTHKKTDRQSIWCEQLRKRCGDNKAAVALANKMARTIWSILANGTSYQQSKAA